MNKEFLVNILTLRPSFLTSSKVEYKFRIATIKTTDLMCI